jgi:hypothetical protein
METIYSTLIFERKNFQNQKRKNCEGKLIQTVTEKEREKEFERE